MTTANLDRATVREARTLPLRQTLPGLIKDPLKAVEEIGGQAQGEIVRLSLGMFRPYLVTHPEHVQRVLRDNAANYRREGMMWKPLSRLVGEASDADPAWPLKKGAFKSLLAGPSIARYADQLVATVAESVDELGERAGPDQPLDAFAEMTRMVYRTIIRVLLGDRIPLSDIDELGKVLVTATTSSFRSRMLLPFIPHSVPLPGDRAFNQSVQAVDELLFPLVRAARRDAERDGNEAGAGGRDVVSLLLGMRDDDGNGLDDRQVRDGIAGLFVASTDTTVSAMTFLWVVLDTHPEVAARLYAEIDEVVGAGPPRYEHLPKLVYTKMVLLELLRLYAVAWITPRTVAADDVIDGVRIRAGSTVAISPYLTHRIASVWPRPEVFDPERFAPGRRRHGFAYLAFGGGLHQCLGRLFFTLEAQLILATLATRFRPELHSPGPVEPRVDITLKPRQRVWITLGPADRAGHGQADAR